MATSTEDRLAAIEARLTAIEDAEAIKKLQALYIRHLSDRKWHEMHALFTDDAVTEISFHARTEGKKQLEDVFADLASHVKNHDGYLLTSPIVDVHGDEATGLWTWTRLYCDHQNPLGMTLRVWGPWMEGRYNATYAKVGGRWLIKYLGFRSTAPDPDMDERARATREGKA
jgi:hypothetical protein